MNTGKRLQYAVNEMREAFLQETPFWSARYVVDGVWIHCWVTNINAYLLENMNLLPRDLGKKAIYVSFSAANEDDSERSDWILIVDGPLAMDLIGKRVGEAFSEFSGRGG